MHQLVTLIVHYGCSTNDSHCHGLVGSPGGHLSLSGTYAKHMPMQRQSQQASGRDMLQEYPPVCPAEVDQTNWLEGPVKTAGCGCGEVEAESFSAIPARSDPRARKGNLGACTFCNTAGRHPGEAVTDCQHHPLEAAAAAAATPASRRSAHCMH